MTTFQPDMRPDLFAGHDTEGTLWSGFSGHGRPVTRTSSTGVGVTLRVLHRCLSDDCVKPGQPNVLLRLSEDGGAWLTASGAEQLGSALLDAARRGA
jgi:hypothetical protein